MTKDEGKKEITYQLTMNLAHELLTRDLISESDYRNFDTKMQQKYDPKIGSLFWQNIPGNR